MNEVIYSKEEIEKLIAPISQKASNSSVIFLHGEIGTGKTFFVQNFLKSLGINETITSPTFSIFNEYHTESLNVFHYDLYRIKNPSELMFVDIEENQEQGMLLIEWPQMAKEFGILPTIEIFLEVYKTKRRAKIIFS
jgi:tRNA threonylcarbamoyladenosine biosynthesis protein TsaE